MSRLKILAIAAHPDDVELGCSGTLYKHKLKGDWVGIVDLTQGELGTRGNATLRLQEAEKARQILEADARYNLKMRDGFFTHDEAHLRPIIEIIRATQPDVVIANALEDRHPDHGKGGKLIADACFLAGLPKIETIYQNQLQSAWRPKRVFHMVQDRWINPTLVVDISETFEKKLASIKAYESQFYTPNADGPTTYISTEGFWNHIESRARQHGKLIGVEFGEAFVCENTVGLSDLSAFLLPELS